MSILLLTGACVGSFINVVAWRLPREESVVWPGSHCPRCGCSVQWHDNIPVIGWLSLRGRCRSCNQPIAARYPVVEALSAGLWLSSAWAIGLGADSISADLVTTLVNLFGGVLLISLLIPLVLIDIDHLWLPEPICRAGVISGLLATGLVAAFSDQQTGGSLLFNHLLASAAGLLVLEALSALAERLVGQPALGLGDAKLAAMAGAWLGLAGLGVAMGIAVISGALFGVAGRITGRLKPREPFPFGPFIAVGIWLVWLMGPEWWWSQWVTLIGP
tara:strand:+ start:1258 stop:2079 length:822 start_codon:yes stop_codon:yes gene_type:complete